MTPRAGRPIPWDHWTYRARVDRVVDGDTVDLVVDQGFGASLGVRVRLLGIDTPELRRGSPQHRAAGRDAAEFVNEWMAAAGDGEWPLAVRTVKTGKYGRWIGDIWRAVDADNLTDGLRAAGFDKAGHPG